MQLILTSPSGIALLFDVTLTGQISMCTDNLTVDAIEVKIWGECVYGSKPNGPAITFASPAGYLMGGTELWVRPADLCERGALLKHEELVRAVEAVREKQREDMRRGPLREKP